MYLKSFHGKEFFIKVVPGQLSLSDTPPNFFLKLSYFATVVFHTTINATRHRFEYLRQSRECLDFLYYFLKLLFSERLVSLSKILAH